MLNWLRGKVTRDGLSLPLDLGSTGTDNSPTSSSRGTLVVVREGAVPKPSLDVNEVQLLSDIKEFQPLLNETTDVQSWNSINAKAMMDLCILYQGHLKSSADGVAVKQTELHTRIKEIDLAIKILMDRLTDRQKSYAKAAEQLQRTADITKSLQSLKTRIAEMEDVMTKLNEGLPADSRLEPFTFTLKNVTLSGA